MADVFLCKTGTLSTRSRSDLRKSGVVVVEVDNPEDCKFIRASEVVSGDDMLWAAMDALRRNFGSYNKGEAQREQFSLNIFELIDAARSADRAEAAGDG